MTTYSAKIYIAYIQNQTNAHLVFRMINLRNRIFIEGVNREESMVEIKGPLNFPSYGCIHFDKVKGGDSLPISYSVLVDIHP